MKRTICFIKTIWNTIIYCASISGHRYLLIYENEDCQVLQCQLCGDISFVWKSK